MNFSLDIPNTAVHGGLRHVEGALYLDDGVRLDAQVKYGPLFV